MSIYYVPGLTLGHPQSDVHQPAFSASCLRSPSLNLVPRSSRPSGRLVSALVRAPGCHDHSPALLTEISSSFEELFQPLGLFPEEPVRNRSTSLWLRCSRQLTLLFQSIAL